MYDGMLAESVWIAGNNGDLIESYFCRPLGPGPYPSVVIIHHAPGYDSGMKEITRRFAVHGYVAICPNLYSRLGVGSFDDMAAMMRAMGGVADDQVVGDVEGAMRFVRALPYGNQKVGIIGYCSGGRHVYLCACRIPSVDAAVDCYGGGVVTPPDQLTPARPVAPIEMTADLACPLLGLFGVEDRNPDPAMVARMEEELKKHSKTYEFHSYEGAGHAFFHPNRPSYRQAAAVDGWSRIWGFFGTHLKA
jgi:carboxymethylenebutenolidase